MTAAVLLDNSAWARLNDPRLDEDRLDEVVAAVQRQLVHVSTPFALEAGYSARDASGHKAMFERFDEMPFAPIDAEIERHAMTAQRDLARRGHHRLPPTGLLIAALADRHRLGVLHYDADYDAILEHTDLRFDSVWLAERGTL